MSTHQSSDSLSHPPPQPGPPLSSLSDLQAPNASMNVRPVLPPAVPLPGSPSLPLYLQPPGSTPQNSNAAMQAEVIRSRKRNWLHGLANLMAQRNMPLPPQLTGVPFPPNYDPANMPWKSLEVSPADLGVVRLAGVDVDLFKLWGTILQHGGGAAVRTSISSSSRAISSSAPRPARLGLAKGRLGRRPRPPRPPRVHALARQSRRDEGRARGPRALLHGPPRPFRGGIPEEHDGEPAARHSSRPRPPRTPWHGRRQPCCCHDAPPQPRPQHEHGRTWSVPLCPGQRHAPPAS